MLIPEWLDENVGSLWLTVYKIMVGLQAMTEDAKKKNPDLWQRFLPLYRQHKVTFHWIKGHAGHPENERCDRLAVAAGAGAVSRGETLPEDPGFTEEETLL